MRAFFILNPAAGSGRARRVEPLIREALRLRGMESSSIAFTRGPGHAAELAQEAADRGYNRVAGVGGDGTLHEIANGLLRSPQLPEFAAIPAGTGNDFAQCLGIPKTIAEAVALACDGASTLAMDVGRCGDRYFLNVAGLGFDADVAMAVNLAPAVLRRLPRAFVLYTLRELVRNRRHPLDIYLDGRHVQRQSLLVAVANGRFYAGGMMIAPPASRSDGLLDVCIIGDVSRLEILQLLPSVFHGGHVRHPKVELHRARVVRIEGLPTTLAQLDGEVAGSPPLQFEVVPRALSVVVPHLQ